MTAPESPLDSSRPVEEKTNSVFEMTKDLLDNPTPKNGTGVDWGWGNDGDSKLDSTRAQAITPPKESDGSLSNETAEMSDGDESLPMVDSEVQGNSDADNDSKAAEKSADPAQTSNDKEMSDSDSEPMSVAPTGGSDKGNATPPHEKDDSDEESLEIVHDDSDKNKGVEEKESSDGEESDDETVDLETEKDKPSEEPTYKLVIPSDSDGDITLDDSDSDDSAGSEDEATNSAPEEEGTEAQVTPCKTLEEHSPESDGTPEDGKTPPSSQRRSGRARKPRTFMAEYDSLAGDIKSKPNKPRKGKVPKKRKKGKEEKGKKQGSSQPDLDDLFQSTDFLFSHADKDAVKVTEIYSALEAEHSCTLTKVTKRKIRERLVDLMKGLADAQSANSEEEEDQEDQVSEQGDSESEASDYEQGSDDEALTKKRTGKATKRTKRAPGPKRPNQRKAAKAARMVEAARLRKKRLEELRIRNEEMQLTESKEDQERATAIAAKFETSTDEMRLQRMEDRLTLLELLDQKRMAVIDDLEATTEKKEPPQEPDTAGAAQEEPQDVPAPEDEEESESSSDEEDLEIVGAKKPFKPLAPLHTSIPSRGVNILKQIGSPQAKKYRQTALRLPTSPSKLMSTAITSPTKSRGARNALRQALKQKQRKMGNLWLARELEYKSEADHLKDCQIAAEQKKKQVLQLEQARLKANQRKNLRERQTASEDAPEESPEPQEADQNGMPDEEDEEMQMAKEIEQESAGISTDSLDAADDGKSSTEAVADESTDTQEEQASEAAPLDIASQEHLETEDSQSPPIDDPDAWDTQPIVAKDTKEIPSGASSENTPAEGAVSTSTSTNEGTSPNVAADAASGATPEPDQTDKTQEAFREDDEEERQFVDDSAELKTDSKRPRNAGWQAMLKKEAEQLKKQKRRKQGIVEDQAEEEEEEEVAGLEDFGFSVKRKKGDDEEESPDNDALDADDLEHVVDDVSDNEGDETAGDVARKKMDQREEKERHKEIMRRMREGYDGRRGGIAGGGVGARGIHRFDQLVAADNREDAKHLGLLNDDEMDSDNEDATTNKTNGNDEEEDEGALLDKMLKDRFLHRSSVDVEESFSDEEAENADNDKDQDGNKSDEEENQTQERLAKRFTKRARMHRLEEQFGASQEFSQQRLIDEDASLKLELSQMKNGLIRRRSVSSTRTSLSSQDSIGKVNPKRPRVGGSFGGSFLEKGGSLSIALRASSQTRRRTTFLGGGKDSKENVAMTHKNVALGHVVFTSQSASRSSFSKSNSNLPGSGSALGTRKRSIGSGTGGSLFQKIAKR